MFEYDPREEETIELIYDSPNANELDNPDNITVTPRGGLLLGEDAARNHFLEGERLVGLTLHGQAFTFAMNNVNLTAEQIAAAGKTIAPGNFTQAEWAGACPTASGSSSTSRRPASRSRSRVPGAGATLEGPGVHGP